VRGEEEEERLDDYGEGGCSLRGAERYRDGRLTSPMCSWYEEVDKGRDKASRSINEWRRVVWDAG
jgi:hypothetical protein